MWTLSEAALFCFLIFFFAVGFEQIVFKKVLRIEQSAQFLHERDFLLAQFQDLLGDVVLECKQSWRLYLKRRCSWDRNLTHEKGHL